MSRLEALGSVAEYELSMSSIENLDEFLHLVDCNGAERLSGVEIYCPRSGARRGGLHQSKDALLSLSLFPPPPPNNKKKKKVRAVHSRQVFGLRVVYLHQFRSGELGQMLTSWRD